MTFDMEPAIVPAPAGGRIGRMYINGSWTSSAESFAEIRSPATGQVVGHVPMGTRADVGAAVASARRGADKMRALSVWDRAACCTRIASAILSRADELAKLLCEEQGKPLHSEARGEVAFAAEAFQVAAEQVKWLETSAFSLRDGQHKGFTFLRPKGVYGIVVPWNYPLSVPCAYYLAPGFAAGNAIVWTAALTTSLVSSLLMECLVEADLPEGAINFVTGAGPDVGDEIVGHPGVDAVGFTGSTVTGDKVAARAKGKPLSLELGGNGPTIVLADADVEAAALAAATGSFRNAGQICTSTERILVHASVHDRFVAALVEATDKVRLGDPLLPGTDMGPLHNQATATKVDMHLEDARRNSATIVRGGGRASGFATDLFYQPTVIANASADSLLNREETFGPVAPVFRFGDRDELFGLVNKSNYGLFASIFTRSLKDAFDYAEALKAGTVHINEMSCYWDLNIPGGGLAGTASGIGRIGIRPSIINMSDEVTLTVNLA